MAPPGQLHNENSRPWRRWLSEYWFRNQDRVEDVLGEAWMRIGKRTDRIGDVGVYLAAGGTVKPMPGCASDMVFEVVSPGKEARHRDYVEKRDECHRPGVREHVILDRFQGRVTVLEWEEGGYRERELTVSEVYTSPLLPGLAIPLAEAI